MASQIIDALLAKLITHFFSQSLIWIDKRCYSITNPRHVKETRTVGFELPLLIITTNTEPH